MAPSPADLEARIWSGHHLELLQGARRGLEITALNALPEPPVGYATGDDTFAASRPLTPGWHL